MVTSQGRELFSRAAILLQQLLEIEESLHAKPDELRGTMRVSVPTAAVEMGLITDLGLLLRRHKRLNLEIHLSDRPVDVLAN
jgi:DNA-binding transcriptional LysR family regulator